MEPLTIEELGIEYSINEGFSEINDSCKDVKEELVMIYANILSDINISVKNISTKNMILVDTCKAIGFGIYLKILSDCMIYINLQFNSPPAFFKVCIYYSPSTILSMVNDDVSNISKLLAIIWINPKNHTSLLLIYSQEQVQKVTKEKEEFIEQTENKEEESMRLKKAFMNFYEQQSKDIVFCLTDSWKN
ncbi:hypothetical protein SteCoe_16467 [Stentor coeruleus]|uniref:Uncharacterized protein n=1 Tax=Stentor coeruleus TaxID=5963 RepID=A0A1R2C166_9CILI|nr:hypothetical protein SteCoe_16467 [Stentor coeruleus]